MFAGIKLLWATQIHFDSSSLARVKMTLKGVQNILQNKTNKNKTKQNIYYAQVCKVYCYCYQFEGH